MQDIVPWTILRFMGGSCDEILQVAEHWRMGTCSSGPSFMIAVHGGLGKFYPNVE